MRSALAKDTLRTIRHSLRRFVSIAAICMLGTTMFVGLTIACEDLRLSADEYFDAQRLYDVSVQSTLGLTDDDVDALGALDGVSAAQGGWKETAYTEVDNASQSVVASATAKDGMNEPYLIEGRLPAAAGEVAVTSDYLADSGKRIGDTLTFGVDGDPSTWAVDDTLERQQAKAQDLLDNIEDADDVELTDDERDLLDQIDADDLARAAIANDMDLTHWADLTDDDLQALLTDAYRGRFDDLSASDATSKELFARHTYTIVAEVGDPTNVAAKHGSSSFRATGARYAFFVSDADATTSAYSVVYLQVAGATELSGFTGAYQDKVDAVLSQAEGIKEQRERAREEQVAADGNAQIDEAEQSANDEFERAQSQIDEAQATIDDARAKLADVGSATWYVQDRSAISSYSSIDSDASSIEVIGTVFPAIFLTVAILMSITTATRMVEEERGLIGLYKALGYPRHRIMAKYAGYTIAATLVGCGVGALLGFVALPEFLFTVFAVMYTLPAFTLHFSAGLCALAFGLFVVGIGAATLITVRGELAECPAALMRPKAPRAGKRILLEHIGPVWRRLSFLNKVTARNLFRYKSRLAMTVFGVAGCCALMIMGFGINDTVQALSPNQYGGAGRAGIYSYDLLAATQPADLEVAAQRLTDSSRVDSYVAVHYENVTVEHDGAKQTMQLVVVPNDFALDGYIDLRTQDGRHLDLAGATADGGALLTKNAAVVLGFGEGDTVRVQDTSLNQADIKVSGIVMNYLGNAAYLTQDSYERLFGQALEPNALLAKLNGTDDEKIAFADELGGDAAFLSVTSVAAGIRDFESNFMLINYVVALVTALAAGLSFVVLFTLATTNISERERELATIKVLGFRKREVRVYINKELLILALIGTIVGIPLGCVLGHSLTYVLNMPSMYFAVEINPLSYVWSCGLSMLFALATSLVTSHSIDRVDMVGALKSAE